ncbi:MAG: HD domain-containing protein [Desulfurococcales archaeon]|nr:HD domain-containing protein [Desulfurococcales archaeon]
MVLVSSMLVEEHISRSFLLKSVWDRLSKDEEVETLLNMSNVMAVERLLYNDHGPVHARIVTGSALEIFDILLESGIQPSTVTQGVVPSDEHAKLIVMLGAYLHDIGNSIHRSNHEFAGALLAREILLRILPEVIEGDRSLIHRIVSEVAHAIYATSNGVQALSIEASIVKVADATDMAEGRARIPYLKGKFDMHALSALSIEKVEIERGGIRPVRIKVYMRDSAGMFQVEKVMLPKVNTSLIGGYVEIIPIITGGEGPNIPPLLP